jgi:hypothetical protein
MMFPSAASAAPAATPAAVAAAPAAAVTAPMPSAVTTLSVRGGGNEERSRKNRESHKPFHTGTPPFTDNSGYASIPAMRIAHLMCQRIENRQWKDSISLLSFNATYYIYSKDFMRPTDSSCNRSSMLQFVSRDRCHAS